METEEYTDSLSPEFANAAALKVILTGDEDAPEYNGRIVSRLSFEGIKDQIMNFGHHPLVEALFGLLKENRATLGSFTHAAKFRFNINNNIVRQAIEDNFSCEIPSNHNMINYGTLVNKRGGVVEDFMCYVDDEGYLNVVGNLCNIDIWYQRFDKFFDSKEAIDITQRKGILYIYGTSGRQLIQQLTGVDIDIVGWRGVEKAIIDGIGEIEVSVTTYTPFGGAEISFPIEQLANVWNRIITLGKQNGIEVQPCGLTGRDIARMLAGLPLGGVDYRIPRSTLEVPPQAIGAVVKPERFLGKEAALLNPIMWIRAYFDLPDRRLTSQEFEALKKYGLAISSLLYIPKQETLARDLRRYTNKDKEVATALASQIIEYLESLGIKPGSHLFILGWGINIVTRISVGELQGKVLPRRIWPTRTK